MHEMNGIELASIIRKMERYSNYTFDCIDVIDIEPSILKFLNNSLNSNNNEFKFRFISLLIFMILNSKKL
jgi:hypothetical protein